MDSQKLTVEEFVLRAIDRLAQSGRTTIHTVYSGFNEAFRTYFPELDPVKEVQRLTDEGKIVSRLARGGAVIGKPGAFAKVSSSKTLQKMGL